MFERFLQARRHERDRSELGLLLKDCRQLLTEQGEANSLAIAARALARYRNLSAASRQQFFEAIASDFDPDPGDVLQLAEKYAVTRSPENLIALTRALDDPARSARAAAVLALVGFVNVPIIKFSVNWWATLHQPASVFRLDGPTIDASMLWPLMIMALGFTIAFFALHMTAMRTEIWRRRVAAMRRVAARRAEREA